MQQNAGRCNSGSSTSTAFTSSNTAGNLIVVGIDYQDTQNISSVTDTQGNVYVRAGSEVHQVAGSTFVDIYYAKNIKSGANTVTVKLRGSAAFFEVYIHEYTGLDTISPLDVTAGNTGNSTNLDSGSATTNFANELIFGFSPNNGGGTTAGPGFTARSTFNGNITEDKIVSAIGSYNATANTNGSAPWSMLMATFKAFPGVGLSCTRRIADCTA